MARLGPADLVLGTVLLLIVALWLVVARGRAAAPRRLLVLGIFGGYLIVLAIIVLWPPAGQPTTADVRRRPRCAVAAGRHRTRPAWPAVERPGRPEPAEP